MKLTIRFDLTIRVNINVPDLMVFNAVVSTLIRASKAPACAICA